MAGGIFLLAAFKIFSCSMPTLVGMQDLIPWPGIKPRRPALGVQSLSHWIIREIFASICCCCSVAKLGPTLCGPKDCMQHARLLCLPRSPRVCSNPCPLSWWCHPTISSFVVPFSSHPQSFPASGSFSMSQLFASGGRSIGVWPSASVLPMNIQGWFPLELTGLISFTV